MHDDVVVSVKEIAERMADCGGLEQRGRHLIQERLEGVVVVLVDDDHVDVCVFQLLRRADACEPSTEDQDTRPLRVVTAHD